MARCTRLALEPDRFPHCRRRSGGDLLAIYARAPQTIGDRGPTWHPASGIQHRTPRRRLNGRKTMDATLYDELHRMEQTNWWFRARRHIVWSLVRRYIGGPSNRRLRVCGLGCG